MIYGRDTLSNGDFPYKVDVQSLTASNGFSVKASEAYIRLGAAVSGLDDINGDGIGDLVAKTTHSNRTYVLNGQAVTGVPSYPAYITDIGQTDGFVLINVTDTQGNTFSHRVSDAGDFNSDGITDLIIGSPEGYEGSEEGGEVYLIYGSANSRK